MQELHKKKIFLIKSIIVLLGILLSFLIFYKESLGKVVPTLSLKGDTNITLEVNKNFKEPGYVATLNSKDLTKDVKVVSSLNTKKIGKYKIEYYLYLNYLNINKKMERVINVVDTTSPELKIEGEKEINIYEDDTYDKPLAKAIDNYDGDISDKIKIFSNLNTSKKGDYDITYQIEDSSKNKSEEKIKVHVLEKKKEEVPEVTPVTNSYIDISISNQKLYYYENDELVLVSDVVTGINNGTPIGNYSILSKAQNIELKGDNYTSFVSYWMAFIGHSYGIHDASWRSSFGGQIYINNGSHGCVNMPTENAARLYYMVQIGTPVHISY